MSMKSTAVPYKIYLSEDEIPQSWYNVRADMKTKPAPLLNPGTGRPMSAEELGVVFCEELVEQELDDTTAYIPIPQEIRDFYKMYRPAPLVRAYCLEQKLGTPAHIYYKFEGNNTSGSHKLNSAIAQAYYAKKQGLRGVTTETGAGQWGTALSMACAYLGLDLKVFMVKVSYEQKPFRREVMRTYGAEVTPSPSMTTAVGRKILEQFPGTTGSLGCAISEAVEVATSQPGYRYVLGSVLNQVLLHQSVIGLEAKTALDKYGVRPDVIIGCAGGGSNLGGLIAPFMGEKLRGEADYRIIAVEPASCPSFTRGKFAYDFCDTGMICPLAKMYTLGSGFIPSPNHAGGLAALRRRADGGPRRRADGGVRGGGALRPLRGHPPRAGELARDPRGDRRGARLQGERRGQGHPLRSHGHGLFRSHGLSEVQRRADERLYPHGRGSCARLRRSAAGPGAGLNPRHQKKADAVFHSVRFLRDHACSEIFSRPGGVPRKRSITRYSGR